MLTVSLRWQVVCLRLLQGFQHAQDEKRVLSIQLFDQRVPVPLSRPDAPDSRTNMPARLFQLGQYLLHSCSLLLVSPCCLRDGGDACSLLLVDAGAVACKGGIALALTTPVVARRFLVLLHLRNPGKNVECRPHFGRDPWLLLDLQGLLSVVARLHQPRLRRAPGLHFVDKQISQVIQISGMDDPARLDSLNTLERTLVPALGFRRVSGAFCHDGEDIATIRRT